METKANALCLALSRYGKLAGRFTAVCSLIIGLMVVGQQEAALALTTPLKQQKAFDESILNTAARSSALMLADHGGEGSAFAASQLLTTPANDAASGILSNSLWVNLLLEIAYARDPEIQKAMKTLSHTDSLTLGTVAGVSTLGVGQSIVSLSTHESKIPPTLGLIGSGISLASLGARSLIGRRNKVRILARQITLRSQLESCIHRLKVGESTASVILTLQQLVGDEASEEFIEIWKAAHR